MKLPFAGPLCIVICAASFTEGAAAKKGKDRHMQFASWDEVNLIAHGLLQLGHGLKQHVDRSKEQLRQVMEQLGSHNRSLAELAGRLDQQRSGLEPPNLPGAHLPQVSASLRAKVEEMEQDRLRMDRALRSVEEKVESLVSRDRAGSSFNSIRSMVVTQSRNINELLTKIEDQQLQLEKQRVQIQILQNQLPENKLQLKDSPYWRSIFKQRMEIFPHTHSSMEPKPDDTMLPVPGKPCAQRLLKAAHCMRQSH